MQRPGKTGIGWAIAIVGFVAIAFAAFRWMVVVNQEQAVDAALDDIPGPESAAVMAASVAPPADAQEVTVTRDVDGDTFVVSGDGPYVDGDAVTIRLLLIDTPEVDGPFTDQECLGPEASAFVKQLVPQGSTLRVVTDTEARDRYGRTLVYAWTADGTFVNETVVRNGFALSVLFEPNDEHVSVITAAEDEARIERRGVWGSC